MDGGSQRIDKWLFFARLTKTRGLAQEIVQAGAVRINREKVSQAARPVRPGDVLTLSLHGHVRVLKVKAPGVRRGPASEAQTLYDDISEPVDRSSEPEAAPAPEARPDRRGREAAIRMKRGDGGW
jgi:ribosome-associated heat shock protein Hsp15